MLMKKYTEYNKGPRQRVGNTGISWFNFQDWVTTASSYRILLFCHGLPLGLVAIIITDPKTASDGELSQGSVYLVFI